MEEKEIFAEEFRTEVTENDVVEMDLPEYTEEFPPIGIVDEDILFPANKSEIYRRNTEIALEEQRKEIARQRAEYERMYREAEEMMRKAEIMQSAANQPSVIEQILSVFSPNRIVDLNRSTVMLAVMVAIGAILLGFLIDLVMDLSL